MHWYIVVTQLAITLSMWKCCDYLKTRSSINVINGITLPKVDDIRWQISTTIGSTVHGKLGNIKFERDISENRFMIWIDNVWIPQKQKNKEYIMEVCRQYQKRKVLESINETKFPELE